MSPSPQGGSGRLVWVRVGRTDHPAFLVVDLDASSNTTAGGGTASGSRGGGGGGGGDGDPRAPAATSSATTTTRIRWSSTGGIEDVPTSSISWNLSPRSRREPANNDNSEDSFGARSAEGRRRRGGSRLSLSKRRRLHRERDRLRKEEEERRAVAAAATAPPRDDDDGSGRVEGDNDDGAADRARISGGVRDGLGAFPLAGADADGPGGNGIVPSEDDHRVRRAADVDVDDTGHNGKSGGGDDNGANAGGSADEIIVIHSNSDEEEEEEEDREEEEKKGIGSFRDGDGDGNGNGNGNGWGHKPAAAEPSRGRGSDDLGGPDDDGYVSSSSSEHGGDDGDDDPDWTGEDDDDDDGEGNDHVGEVSENSSAKRKGSPIAAAATGTPREGVALSKGPSSPSEVSPRGVDGGDCHRPVSCQRPSSCTTKEGRSPQQPVGTEGMTTTPASSSAAAADDTFARSCGDDLASAVAGGTDVICFSQFAFGNTAPRPTIGHNRSAARLSRSHHSIVSNRKTSVLSSHKKRMSSFEDQAISDLSIDERNRFRIKWQSLSDPSAPIEDRRFHVLIAARLHARAQEPVVRDAMQKLRSFYAEQAGAKQGETLISSSLCINDVARSDPEDLARVISSVHFANSKARQIVQAAKDIKSKFGGFVPESRHGLLQVCGIGPKLAEFLSYVNCRSAYDQDSTGASTRPSAKPSCPLKTKTKKARKEATDVICLLEDDDDDGDCNRSGVAVERRPPPPPPGKMGSSKFGAGPRGVEGDSDRHDPTVTERSKAAAVADSNDAAPSSRPMRGGVGASEDDPVGTTTTTTTVVPDSSTSSSSPKSTSKSSCPPPPPPPPERGERAAAAASGTATTAVTPSPSSDPTTILRRDGVGFGFGRGRGRGGGGGPDHSSPRRGGHDAAAVAVAVSPTPRPPRPSTDYGRPSLRAEEEEPGAAGGASAGLATTGISHASVTSADAAGGGRTPRIGSAARSSAYLLHLAEMCHAVLLGGGDDGDGPGFWHGLFRWEYGDDLSAVAALARFHVPHPHANPGAETAPSKVDSSGGGGDDVLREEERTTTTTEEGEEGEEDEEDELLARAMLLYSRMFVRKGPWFRADDLLRYYTTGGAWRGGGGGEGGRSSSSPREDEAPRTRCVSTSSSSSCGGGGTNTSGNVSEPHDGVEEDSSSPPPDHHHSDGSPTSRPRTTPAIPSSEFSTGMRRSHPTMEEESQERDGSKRRCDDDSSSSGRRPCRSDTGRTCVDATAQEGGAGDGSPPPTDASSSSRPRDASAAKLVDGTMRCGSDVSPVTLTPTTSRSGPSHAKPATDDDGGDIRSAKGGVEESVSSSDGGRMEDVRRCGAPPVGRSSTPSPVEGGADGGQEEEEDPLNALLTDIDRLHSMGLVRTFRDETECAVIAGNDRYADGGGGILLADERRTVLHRLGGGGSQRRTSGGGGGGGGGGRGRGRGGGEGRSKQRSNLSRNQIVQQMRSQRSIVFSPKGKGASLSGGATLLPVRRHVRDVVLRSLRDKHARYCGGKQNPSRAGSQVGVGTCNPSSIGDSEEKTTLCQRLQSLRNLPPLCIRLREGPLIVLRRLCRLYLVASAGPGQMRGGEAGWLSVRERETSPQDGRRASLPSYVSQALGSTVGGWHNVQFPGLQHRLKIRTFEHVSIYHEISQLSKRHRNNDAHSEREKRCNADANLFVGGISEFHTWEMAAEIRASMDLLMEMNELCQVMVRRQKKKKEEESKDAPDSGDSGRRTSHSDGGQIGKGADVCGDNHPEDMLDIEDTFDLLTVEGRHSLVRKLLEGGGILSGDVATRACRDVEAALCELIVAGGDARLGVEKADDDVAVRGNRSDAEEEKCDRFENSAERIICALAIVATEVLLVRIPSMREDELKRLIEQPWLRHLQAEAVLAYCVWDAVEILEKRRYYGPAVRMLAMIVGIHPNLAAVHRINGRKEEHASSRNDLIQGFVHALLSRRNRGKAFERLIVDCTHLMRIAKKMNQKQGTYRQTWMDSVCLLSGGHCQEFDGVDMNDAQHLCANVILRVGQSGSVPFSFIRGFARRLKRPLAHTMVGVRNEEMSVLKIRLRNGEVVDEEKFSCRLQNHDESHSCSLDHDSEDMKLADHESVQKHAELPVALPPRDDTSSVVCTNQISSEEKSRPITLIDDSDEEKALFEDKVLTGGKKRSSQHNASSCAVIRRKKMRRGKPQPNEKPNKTLGTEKKPKEGYLDWNPITDFSVANSMNSNVGGRCSFVGWEDEGGKSIMNRSLNVEELALEEYHSGRLPKDNLRGLAGGGWIGWHDEGGHVRALFRILCSTFLFGCPQQSAMGPRSIFLTPYQSAPLDLHVGHAHASGESSLKSFYFRRKQHIDEFLAELEGLSDANLCDLVHRRISENVCKSKDFTRDTLLTRDANELRTLSMIAAGFGGKMLATMFRCLLFDYRHYSGGMPDLLLARARYDDVEAHCAPELVDLGKWVGEAFDSDVASEGRIADLVKVLTERDDEFLGCTKSSESSASSAGLWKRDSRRAKHVDNKGKRLDISMPEKLSLAHNERRVRVECMFVEVKSANDRLDGRQEDWLNILDAVGNARVCKFGSGRSRASSCASDGKNLSGSTKYTIDERSS